jgi:LysR family glycine cleavage system transcriptional activator
MVRLPPFFALRALEAAARHRSYTRAGEELCVTHGAISQQIRRLEAELGARLFERRGGEMVPSANAQKLAIEVGRGLGVMEAAVVAFAGSAERDPLVVSVDSQFANRWLPSRLSRLLAAPAGAHLDLRVDDRLADFITDGVDLGLRYGRGDWRGLECSRLFLEALLPVCSPAFLERHPITEPRDLLGVPLLHHGHRPWSLWFSSFGLQAPAPHGMVYDDSVMLLEAAAQGLGVALARDTLVEIDLRSGRLVEPLQTRTPSDLGFWLVWRADNRKVARIAALRDWLIAEATDADPR